MKTRLHPEGRGCIECGKIISRKAKNWCRECWTNEARSRVGEKNHQWKGDKASRYAYNSAIKRRYGKAKECSNINCSKKSKKYRWVRLKSKSGRRGGIWIQLCQSCVVTLSSVYETQKGTI